MSVRHKKYCVSPSQLLSGLAKLQLQGLLCDAELQVEGKVFKAHKAVLAAASPYFSAMYSTARFKESVQTPTLLQVSRKCWTKQKFILLSKKNKRNKGH